MITKAVRTEKLKVGRAATVAMAGSRLYAGQLQAEVESNRREIERLRALNDSIVARANNHQRDVLDAIAEDAGVGAIPFDGLSIEEHPDGTSTISWPVTFEVMPKEDDPTPIPEKVPAQADG